MHEICIAEASFSSSPHFGLDADADDNDDDYNDERSDGDNECVMRMMVLVVFWTVMIMTYILGRCFGLR